MDNNQSRSLPAIRKRILQEKQTLLKESEQYKDALVTQVDETVIEVKRSGRQALFVGAAFVGAYALVYLLTAARRPKQVAPQTSTLEHPPVAVNSSRPEPAIIRMIKAHISQFLLELAKKELKKLLIKLTKKVN